MDEASVTIKVSESVDPVSTQGGDMQGTLKPSGTERGTTVAARSEIHESDRMVGSQKRAVGVTEEVIGAMDCPSCVHPFSSKPHTTTQPFHVALLTVFFEHYSSDMPRDHKDTVAPP